MSCRIEDYGLIGDCETAALVGRDGSIDWLCWPAFDSDACFAALLGTHRHGRWLIAPAEEVTGTSRRYWDDTLILETRFETADGAVDLIDFMPPRGNASDVVRMVRGVRGRVRMRMQLVIRFGFGADIPWVKKSEDGTALLAICGPDMTVLRTPVETRGEDLTTVADFEVGEGDTVPFVLTYGPSHLPVPKPIDPAYALQDTQAFWTEWCSRCTYHGEYRDLVMRSLITLKAQTFAPTGGIVAAPTTSLPEKLGGARNWDYRFCWLRDATFTLLALMNSGYTEEAAAWLHWLLRAAAGSPVNMQIMYGIMGQRRLLEWEATWLPGYEGAKPVRIDTVVVSTQHAPEISLSQLREEIVGKVIKEICSDWITANSKFLVNPTGRFVIGGPQADTGLTGRKVIADTYGGAGRHGGGAFSGKDPSKVDRSACYMARYIAKNIVAAGLADKCEVQLAYAIGLPDPVSVMVNTFGTSRIDDELIEGRVKNSFEMKPADIIRILNLKRPIYKKTAAYGHFGRNEPEFTWERTDKMSDLAG